MEKVDFFFVSANCLPISLAKNELRIRRIQCNESLLCYCAIGNSANRSELMTTQLVGNKCEGGQWTCSPPKECCKTGCCYLFSTSLYKGSSSNPQPGSVFNPLFLGHWYFWLAVTATVAGILCACSLWRKHSQGSLCCKDSGRDERVSEPDSNGSCYVPPQYSRCNSFHQAPPPYSEVTSKPDLYPLVISYNAEPVKSNNGSTGYLMVQYFRNFIVRPVGSLSATSTIDSLSSSFLCNAANEANNIIPPPYSHMGSLEEVTTDSHLPTTQLTAAAAEQRHLPRSASNHSNVEYHQLLHTSPSVHNQLSNPLIPLVTPTHQLPTPRRQTQVVSIRDNPCFGQNTTNILNNVSPAVPNDVEISSRTGRVESKSQNNCDASVATCRVNRRITKNKLSKEDSESQDDEHNFSDLLNLSVCMPSSIVQLDNPIQSSSHLQELQYSVTNSIGSDISSLANLGSPDSPPRATSPTVEMKELLDKIQQLPQQKSPILGMQQQVEPKNNRSYFHKVKAKTLYMPLYDSNASTRSKNVSSVFSRGWLSRSAPCTPCANFAPNFPIHHQRSSQKGSKTKINDGSPLLREHVEESEDEPSKDECL
ncbi:hypothetical protein NQ315_017260 [Exocentrus adspersus]|uniref:WW domain binding protein VOPP1 n=1 Tax=Exocentrus adspersus TaxID=1586481 RepID=A0AAV8VFK0_9CUCU|nr:hypothetical protein NQ315_017260 [Exocentrus adspersus]